MKKPLKKQRFFYEENFLKNLNGDLSHNSHDKDHVQFIVSMMQIIFVQLS